MYNKLPYWLPPFYMQSDCEMQSLGKVLVLVEFSKYFSDLKCQWIFTQTLNVAKNIYIYI